MRIPFTQDQISKKGAVVGTAIVAGTTLATEHVVVPYGAKAVGWVLFKLFGDKSAEAEAEVGSTLRTSHRKAAHAQ